MINHTQKLDGGFFFSNRETGLRKKIPFSKAKVNGEIYYVHILLEEQLCTVYTTLVVFVCTIPLDGYGSINIVYQFTWRGGGGEVINMPINVSVWRILLMSIWKYVHQMDLQHVVTEMI